MMRRTTTLLVGAVLATAGCSGGTNEADGARSAATSFAQAVQAKDLAKAPLTQQGRAAATSLPKILDGMASVTPKVEVKDVSSPADGRATATLAYSWAPRAGLAPWTYTTTLPMVKTDGTWAADYQPAAVAPGATTGTRLALTSLPARRGDITGAGGAVLVTLRPVVRYGIDKANTPVAQLDSSARALAKVVGIDGDEYARRVLAGGPRAFVEAIVYRKGGADEARTKPLAAKIPGVGSTAGELPLGPTSTFARPLLGSVGEATAEMVATGKGAVRAGDVVGTSGIQLTRDAVLRGTPGYRVVATDAATPDAPAKTLAEVRPVDGAPVATRLDPGLQDRAEAILAKVAPASAVVAIRPSTGDVVAAASGPGSKGYSTATLAQVAPGSTFKVVTALALARAGVGPGTQVSCPTSLTVDGRVFTNYDAYPTSRTGVVPFRTAFAHSCNTAFMGERAKVDQQALADAAAGLGMTSASLGVPAYLGTVPLQATQVEHAASMIGQGKVLASPLGMATVAASVVAGHPVAPRLVLTPAAAPSSGSASPSTSASTSVAASKPVTAAEAASLRELMTAVVAEGSGSVLSDLPGAMAKTGTAEFGDAVPPRTHAWMIGARGDLAVAVFVDEGAGGATTAGPLLHAVLAG